MGSSGWRCTCRESRASTTSSGARPKPGASPTETCSIRTRSSSPPTTSSTPTCRGCWRISRTTSACARSGRVKGERRVRSERHDFLLEIGTEELPPGALRSLEEALVAGLAAGLRKTGLAHGELAGFATPRRLAVRAKRLAARQPEQHVKRRGPPLAAAFGPGGEPTRAALAFAESCGTRVEALEQLDEGKGKFLFFIGTKPGERAIDLLPDLVREVLDALPVPRRMHWGEGTAMFVRPVHWVVMLLGSEV